MPNHFNREQILELLMVKKNIQDRFSNLLVDQLRDSISSGKVHAHKVIDEIHNIELDRKSRTPKETQFKHAPLRELWKKHFFQSNFIPHNILNEWQLNHAESKKIDRLYKSIMKKTTDPHKISSILAQTIVMDTFNRRSSAGKLTGEWLIFAKNNGQNYYLTVAFHKENDHEIRSRIDKSCIEQFPFLKYILFNKN